jgi:hypothetical protein
VLVTPSRLVLRSATGRRKKSYHRRMSSVRVRQAHAEDVKAMARIHVQSWQETYRGLMADEILDQPGFVERRERFWAAALGDERYLANRVAVAERGGQLVGIAMAGPAQDPMLTGRSSLASSTCWPPSTAPELAVGYLRP